MKLRRENWSASGRGARPWAIPPTPAPPFPQPSSCSGAKTPACRPGAGLGRSPSESSLRSRARSDCFRLLCRYGAREEAKRRREPGSGSRSVLTAPWAEWAMGDPGSSVTGDRPGGRSWCLRRVGMSAGWLLLEDGNEVTVGRGFGVTYQLVSKICPLMISRNHCVLKQNAEGQWTIMDNKSLNGVWLNRERLEPLKVYSIRKGDHIQLGVPLENKENAEYEYEVTEEDWERIYPCLSPKNDQMMEKNKGLRTKRKFSLDELEGSGSEGPSNLKSKMSKVSCEPGQPVKSHGKGEVVSQPPEFLDPKLTSLELRGKTTGARVYPDPTKVVELHHKKQKASTPSASQSSLELFRATMSRILKLKTQMQEKQVAVLNVKKQTRKGNSKNIVKMEQELQDLQTQLCAEQAQQQARVEQLEKTFQEEQQHLQGLEKEQGEEDLKQQLAQALQEHRALMQELDRSRKDFEAIIQAKNKELEQTKEEKEKVQAQKEEVLSHMNDVLENELQCIICSEYFIEVVASSGSRLLTLPALNRASAAQAASAPGNIPQSLFFQELTVAI